VVCQRIGRKGAFAITFVAAMLATASVFWFLEPGPVSGRLTFGQEAAVFHQIFWLIPIMGFCQLALFGGYAIYFPELFPTHLRSTGTSFCYNVGRFVAASGPTILGLLTSRVFSEANGYHFEVRPGDEGPAVAGGRPRLHPLSMSAPAQVAEAISGLIERVTFFKEETGFCVLRVQVKGRRELVTVIASLPAVSAGEWITAEGHWVRDREHGLQLKAALAKTVPPTSREGIEKYLGSGMVKGIGPVYAKKLVAHFGERIFDVIEAESARLEEVNGIGPGRRRKIKDAWIEQRFIREIMVFLHSHGVSTARAVRIYKLYGEQAIEKVRENPYRLAKDVPGIGFQTADKIAQKLGIPADSILRACAGIEYLLGEAAGEGHCALPRAVVLEQAPKLLGVPERLIAEALFKLIQQNDLEPELIGEEELLFLPRLRQGEIEIASRLLQLLRGQSAYPQIDVPKAVEWVQKRTGKTLAPSQRAALEQALRSRVLVITGGPGVGKTTLVNSILAILTAKKVRVLLCAPTGRAARRLSESTGLPAQTIHRLLEVQAGGFARNDRNPLEGDLLVVDESSMIDVPLMSALLKAHPPGAGLILVGDVDQLPSVGPGSLLTDIIDSQCVPVVRLTEVFRQAANSRIITTAHQVNAGRFPDAPAPEGLSDFYFIERDEPEDILATLLETVRERIPRKFHLDPIRDVQVLCPMHRALLGVRELNASLQNLLNPARGDEPQVEKFGQAFRVRDKVIQTENNYDKEVFNGDIGLIARIDPVERELHVRYDQREVVYEFGELDEISLACAITIHKSQGSEFPAVVIPVATQQYLMLQRNLLYTGITRGKKLVVLVGQKKALAMAIRNNRSARRYTGLLARLRQGESQAAPD
jgi:exodeoxyribonuclease V alpha subunit